MRQILSLVILVAALSTARAAEITLDPEAAVKQPVGAKVLVRFTVLSDHSPRKGFVILNSCASFKDAQNVPCICKGRGVQPGELVGKTMLIRGTISEYRGKRQIEAISLSVTK